MESHNEVCVSEVVDSETTTDSLNHMCGGPPDNMPTLKDTEIRGPNSSQAVLVSVTTEQNKACSSHSDLTASPKCSNECKMEMVQLKSQPIDLPDEPSEMLSPSHAEVDDLFLPHIIDQSYTGEEMQIEQIDASNTAQTTSGPEDVSPINIIPANFKLDKSQPDPVTASPSNLMNVESENTQLSSKEMVKDWEASDALPSCSNSQLETTHNNDQERVFFTISNHNSDKDNQIPSTSRNYIGNENTSETLKSEPGNQLEELESKNKFGAFLIPKVNIYGENKGPRFYDVSDDFVSKPIIPTKLSEAFSDLPIFGRPKQKSLLPEFQYNKIKEFVGCDLEDGEFQRLADYCGPDRLRTGKELTMPNNPCQGFYPSWMEKLNDNLQDFTAHHSLNIVRKHKLRVENDTKNLYSKRYKYRGIRMMSLGNEEDDNTPVVTLGTPVLPGKDLIFVIRWYRPFSYNPKDKNQYRTRHSVFSCNIVMLGRHKLSLLRDRFVCPNDLDMRVDVSDRPDELPASTAKEMFPSGFLFINNVFYVDARARCADYSAGVRRWARARALGDFPRRDLALRLDQLPVRLGHPEVYVHQGNCEHLFTFSEIRLVNSSDPLKLSAYPCQTALSQNQTIYCTTCAEFGAKWIVVGCPRVPFDPAFFCEKCFKLYLYKDGKKIGDFKAYLYRGNGINVMKPQG